ncbi:MAG: hypothetical protein ABI968_11460, partial [Acidobacteriota bacterium]
CQRLYIYDRMNTFFKLYLEAWLLFAAAAAALVFRSRAHRGTWNRWAFPARAGLLLLVGAAIFTSVTAGRAALSRHFTAYSGPSLDGLRYLKERHPGEYLAVLWMRRTLDGTPVVLEAKGPPYQDFGRISMLTGLPTILGWDYHVKQRGNPESEIPKRTQAILAIYSNPQSPTTLALLRAYRVGYVYVGWLEQRTYPPEALRKFRTHKALYELAYENPESQVYRVIGGPAQDLLVPAKESLPENSQPNPEREEPEEPPAILEKPAGVEHPFAGLREPRGADVDSRGRLWIADFGNSKLRIFDPDGGSLGGWGGRNSGEFGFRELAGVAIRGDSLYVADTWNGRIRSFTTAGVLQATAGELYGPRGIAVAPDGRVWVADTGNHRVLSYDAGLQDRQVFGKKGDGPEDFSSPVGVAVAASGAVYIADSENRRIRVLAPDGKLRGNMPVSGWGPHVEPCLTIDDDGTIYATDPASSTVLELDASGTMRRRIVVDEAGQKFNNPTGIALDRKHRILYVINTGTSSVSKIPLSPRRAP